MSELVHFAPDVVAEGPADHPVNPSSLPGEFAQRLRQALRGRPEANVIVDDDNVTVLRLTPDGPDVTAILSDGRCTLVIGSWHDDMASLDDTIAYARMAVEGNVRVRIDELGGKPWQFALERRLDDGSWKEESLLAVPRLRLWTQSKSTRYLQNSVA